MFTVITKQPIYNKITRFWKKNNTINAVVCFSDIVSKILVWQGLFIHNQQITLVLGSLSVYLNISNFSMLLLFMSSDL